MAKFGLNATIREYGPLTKSCFVLVDPAFGNILKPHQLAGIRFINQEEVSQFELAIVGFNPPNLGTN